LNTIVATNLGNFKQYKAYNDSENNALLGFLKVAGVEIVRDKGLVGKITGIKMPATGGKPLDPVAEARRKELIAKLTPLTQDTLKPEHGADLQEAAGLGVTDREVPIMALPPEVISNILKPNLHAAAQSGKPENDKLWKDAGGITKKAKVDVSTGKVTSGPFTLDATTGLWRK